MLRLRIILSKLYLGEDCPRCGRGRCLPDGDLLRDLAEGEGVLGLLRRGRTESVLVVDLLNVLFFEQMFLANVKLHHR